jgi:DeoR family suf operon transcriptional repressor
MDGTLPIAPSSNTVLTPRHRGVRARILLELKKAQRVTAKELASRLRVSLNGIRHHLKELESQGLIEYERQYHGVGAPAFAYRLTAAGEALFPRRYEAILNEVLDQVALREGRNGAVAVLEARYATLTRRLQEQLAGAAPADRMASLARLLSDEGYMPEATATSTDGTLIEHNCAIESVAQRFPEVCAAEAKFLAAVLGAQVERQSHILSGCSACEYRVHFDPQPSWGAGVTDGTMPEGLPPVPPSTMETA